MNLHVVNAKTVIPVLSYQLPKDTNNKKGLSLTSDKRHSNPIKQKALHIPEHHPFINRN